jgi:hypothetical protein
LSTPIAVVAALASALVLGISSVADQRSTKRVQSRQALSPRIITLLAPVQAIISAADPVISIALGVGWLAVRLRGGPAATGEVISLLLLTAGIVMTAYHVPQTGDAGVAPGHRPGLRLGPVTGATGPQGRECGHKQK